MSYRKHRKNKVMKEKVKQVRSGGDTSAQAQSRMNMREGRGRAQTEKKGK
jgi:hypothetical protein